MFEENKKHTAPEHFRLECVDGQNILRPLPEPSFADVRFFMRGPVMDGTDGRASRIMNSITSAQAGFANIGSRPLIAPSQVHGVQILVITSENNVDASTFVMPTQPKADGILLLSRDFEASLRFGDCAPVLILPSDKWVRENNIPWALLMHSGYKGTVQNIISSGLTTLEQTLTRDCDEKTAHDAILNARAWVFPCIAGEHYPRTLEDWTRRGLDTFHPENFCHVEHPEDRDGHCEHFYFDIAGELRCQLLDCGLSDTNIYLSPWTSVSDHELCYSYRCGDADRMFLHVVLTDRA